MRLLERLFKVKKRTCMWFNRKRCIFSILLLSSSCVSLAQSEPPRKGQFSGLVKLGLVASQIHNDDVGGYNKLGGSAGFGVFTPISRSAKIQLELNYAMRGSRKAARPDKGDFNSFTLEAHYIDIPILYRSHLAMFDYEVGLCNGILVYQDIRNLSGAIPNLSPFNRYELALNAGVSVPMNQNWSFSARFHYSILPAIGQLQLINGINVIGGAYNNAISFCLIRTISPKN